MGFVAKAPTRERIEKLVEEVNNTLRIHKADEIETYLVGHELQKINLRYLRLDLVVDARSV